MSRLWDMSRTGAQLLFCAERVLGLSSGDTHLTFLVPTAFHPLLALLLWAFGICISKCRVLRASTKQSADATKQVLAVRMSYSMPLGNASLRCGKVSPLEDLTITSTHLTINYEFLQNPYKTSTLCGFIVRFHGFIVRNCAFGNAIFVVDSGPSAVDSEKPLIANN